MKFAKLPAWIVITSPVIAATELSAAQIFEAILTRSVNLSGPVLETNGRFRKDDSVPRPD